MKANIVEIMKDTVLVETLVGTFEAIWRSPFPPKIGQCYIEIDSNDIITLKQIMLSSKNKPLIEQENGKLSICGLFEEIEDDIAFVRIDDSIIMLNIRASDDYSIFIGKFVRIIINSIELYDIS